MFKYALNQVVFYMLDSKVHSAPVVTRMVVENAHDDWALTNEQKYSWQRLGVSQVTYVTVHAVLTEDKVFPSREALADLI